MTENKNYFPALTGMRAVAAFMVFLIHWNPAQEGSFLYGLFNELHIGVSVFFVLSGFLIAYRYYNRENIPFRNYFINRFARIYPMYFLITTATYITLYIGHKYDSLPALGKIYFLNITFLRGFFDDLKFSGVPQGWSLTVEELFYITAPLSFFLIRRSLWNLIFIPVLLVMTGIMIVFVFGNPAYFGFMGNVTFMLVHTFFGRCFEFFTGIALALLYMKFGAKIKTRFATYLGLLIILICVYFLSRLKEDAYVQGLYHPLGIAINNLILPMGGISLLFWGLLTEKTFIRKLLSTDLMVLLGKSSYSFYLIHIGIILTWFKDLNIRNAVSFLLLQIISIILFKFVEEPLNAFIRKKFVSKKSSFDIVKIPLDSSLKQN